MDEHDGISGPIRLKKSAPNIRELGGRDVLKARFAVVFCISHFPDAFHPTAIPARVLRSGLEGPG